MKKNVYGIIITILCIINILFMIFCYFVYDMGKINNIYIIGGTIISIVLLILLFKNNVYGYIGTIIFYGIQMIGTVLIFDNFRYGLIFRQESNMTINSNSFLEDLNFTAILIVILSFLGYYRHMKLQELKTDSQTE
ncbi:hypothetical protein BXY80_1658 [Ichthyenterobacterium magnum]|uniref:Uncharacterized protein n=2 Tax=Ichthyenterobacterium magnum TaxID=1230530 RepID=A0A420DMF5_9FLAO|nr:hypothetical protein BXY80_1658 [Ichthyenterobacterium magnum]